MSTIPATDVPTTRTGEAGPRSARGPDATASDQAAPDSLRGLQGHQIDLVLGSEKLRPPSILEHQAGAGAGVVRDLRLHQRPDGPKQLARLTDIVEQAVSWVPAAVRREATIRLENEGAPDVIVSLGQIVQVVVHLLVHAAHAVRPGRPFVVISRIAPGAPGMARLDVIADEASPDPRVLFHLFETCRAIVTAHGGTLTVASAVGAGTTFRLELPGAAVA